MARANPQSRAQRAHTHVSHMHATTHILPTLLRAQTTHTHNASPCAAHSIQLKPICNTRWHVMCIACIASQGAPRSQPMALARFPVRTEISTVAHQRLSVCPRLGDVAIRCASMGCGEQAQPIVRTPRRHDCLEGLAHGGAVHCGKLQTSSQRTGALHVWLAKATGIHPCHTGCEQSVRLAPPGRQRVGTCINAN